MKRSDPRLFADIFAEGMQRAGLSDTYDLQRASYLWSEVVGPTVNRLTTRRYIDDTGTLHVYISSAPLKSELSFLTATLAERINNAVGKNVVKAIVIH